MRRCPCRDGAQLGVRNSHHNRRPISNRSCPSRIHRSAQELINTGREFFALTTAKELCGEGQLMGLNSAPWALTPFSRFPPYTLVGKGF